MTETVPSYGSPLDFGEKVADDALPLGVDLTPEPTLGHQLGVLFSRTDSVEKREMFAPVGAGFQAARAGPDWGWNKARYERDAMREITTALRARGHDVSAISAGEAENNQRRLDRGEKLLPEQLARLEAFNATIGALAAERKRDPGFLSQFADVRDLASFRAHVAGKRRGDLDQAEGVLARTGTVGTIGGFAGMIGAGALDPTSYIPVGGGATEGLSLGRQILNMALREGAANAGLQLAEEPLVREDATELGIERDASDTLRDVAVAGAFGAVLGGGAKAVELGAEHLGDGIASLREAAIAKHFDKLPEGWKQRMIEAGTLRDRADIAAMRDTIGADRLAPEELAAVRAVEADADVRESNPFLFSTSADALHGQRLAASIDALLAGEPPPRFTPPARLPFASATALARSDSEIAGRIIMAESGGNPRARNPVPGQTASGLGQFTDETWLSGIKRWFPGRARGKTREQLLALKTNPELGRKMTERAVAYYRETLTKADVPVTPVNSYLMHFVGPQRAIAMIHAADNLPVKRLLPEAVIAANESVLRDRTVGEVKAWAKKRMGVADAAASEPPPAEGVALRPDQFETPEDLRAAETALYGREMGPFGPVHRDVAGDWKEAVTRLTRDRTGEVPGALEHPEVGPIDLVWGNEKGGLQHILERHPEVIDRLPEIIAQLPVKSRSENRVRLEDEAHSAGVRLDYDGEAKRWLVTAYQKDPARADVTRAGADGLAGSPALGSAPNINATHRAGKKRRAGREEGPVDLLTQVARWGGLRNDEGHDLATTGGLAKRMTRGGRVLNRNGLSVDALGEKLWDAGWFGPPSTVDRPTEADVLELLDEAARAGKRFHPEEQHLVAERLRTLDEGDDEIRALLGEAAAAEGITLDEDLAAAAIDRMRRGEDPEDALIGAINDRFRDEIAASQPLDPEALPELPQGAMEADDWATLEELQGGLAGWDDPDAEAAIEQALSLEHDLRMAIAAGEAGDVVLEDGAHDVARLLDDADQAERAAEAMRTCMTPVKGDGE